ncbi:MAG: galactoside O-acetyltransferase [Clostridia bacterium]|nr:galactoside O-acetyltransferase [Clostridia bacterium]
MECNEVAVDVRNIPQAELEEGRRLNEKVYRFNRSMPMSDECFKLLKEVFGKNIGKNTVVNPPLYGAAIDRMKIGSRVFINSNLLAMARGKITIEDDVQIAGNVSLLSNNHDLYDRQILLCKPIIIRQGAWIGANASILPGVEIGKYAVVGAGSVVTKDVPDYTVVVGNPAKPVKTLDASRF